MIAETVLDALSVLVRWVPIRAKIVSTCEQGVRWRLGRAVQWINKPGLYWYIAWIEEISVEAVVPKEIETEWQCVTTSDGKTRSFSVGCQYETANLLLQQTQVDDFENSLSNLIGRIAATVMRTTDDPEPDKAILTRVRTQAEKWGVHIRYLGLMNDVKSRPLHLLGTMGRQ